jgi:hypothetical protein
MIVLGTPKDALIAAALEHYLYVGGWMSIRSAPTTIQEFSAAPDRFLEHCFAIFAVVSDGALLCKKLATLRAATTRPVIAVSYLATALELRNALRAGASDALDFSQPVDREIRAICCRILTGSRLPNRAFRTLGALSPQERRLAMLLLKCTVAPLAASHLLKQADATQESLEPVRRKLQETLGDDLGMLIRAA